MAHIECPKCKLEASCVSVHMRRKTGEKPYYYMTFHHDAPQFMRKSRTCTWRFGEWSPTLKLLPIDRLMDDASMSQLRGRKPRYPRPSGPSQ